MILVVVCTTMYLFVKVFWCPCKAIKVRPTLMGTKNLYENGPNPFFLFGTKNLVRSTLKGTKNLRYTKMDQIDRSGCVLIFL